MFFNQQFIRLLSLCYCLVFTTGFLVHAQSLNLPNAGSYLLAGDLDISGNQITVEADILITGSSSINIISKHTNPLNVNYLFRPGAFGVTTYNSGNSGATSIYFVITDYKFEHFRWYHVAATYDGVRLKYYVDDCLIGSTPARGNMVQNNLQTYIGNNSSNVEQFIGQIDEVRIWNIARTQEEIIANRANLPNPTTLPGLQLYYKFDGNYTNLQGNSLYNGTPYGNTNLNGINSIVQANIPSTLLAYYPFNGDAQDLSGNANHGTVIGPVPVADRFGNLQQAYFFDGIDDYILVNDDESLRPNYLSIAFWTKLTETPSTTTILTKGTLSDASHGNYGVGISNDNLVLCLFSDDDCSSDAGFICNERTVDFGIERWAHVVITYDGNKWRFYKNGILVTESELSVNINSCETGTLNIGRWWDGAPGYFKGTLDDLRMYGNALTALEVTELYTAEQNTNNENWEDDLVLHYNFDQGLANDLSGKENNGLLNDVSVAADRFGNPTGALRISEGQFIEVPHSPSLVFKNEMSLSLWLAPDNFPTPFSAIIQKAINDDLNDYSFQWGFNNNGFGADFKTNAGVQTTNGAFVLTPNNWYHLVLVWDGRNTKLFLNNELLGTGTTTGILNSSIGSLFIGYNPVGSPEYLSGRIDDVRIYNFALDICQVKDIYETESPSVTNTPLSTAIDGYWQGVLYQGEDETPDFSFGYALNTNENTGLITGVSTIQFINQSNYYGNIALDAYLVDDVFVATEDHIISQLHPNNFTWCIKSHELNYSSQNNRMFGSWSAPGCTPGEIEVYKLEITNIDCMYGLTHISAIGNNLQWYSDSLAISASYFGNEISINSTESTIFWVSQTNYGIESPRYPIEITAPEIRDFTEGLNAYFPFSSNALDESGHNNNGTISGASLTTDRFGNENAACSFNGLDDYIQINNEMQLGNEYTFTAWIKTNNITDIKQTVISKYETDQFAPYWFGLVNSKPSIRISDGAGSYVEAFSNISISENEWTQLVWTGKNNELDFYINGIYDYTTSVPTIIQNDELVMIGRQAFGINGTNFNTFNGILDDIRVYNRALNSCEIAELFTLERPNATTTPGTYQVYGNEDQEEVIDLVVIEDKIYVTAQKWNGDFNSTADIIMARFDTLGRLETTKLIGSDTRDLPCQLIQGSNGPLLLGRTIARQSLNCLLCDDILLFDLNTDLDIVQEQYFGVSYWDEVGWSIFKKEEGYILAAREYVENNDMYILRLDENLTPVWSGRYSSNNSSEWSAVNEIKGNSTDNSIFVIGSNSTTSPVTFVTKLSSDGTPIFRKEYSISTISSLEDLSTSFTTDGNLLIARSVAVNGFYDILLMMIDQNGNLIWNKLIGGDNGHEIIKDMIRIKNTNEFILVGSTTSAGFGETDAFFIKIDANGSIITAKTFGDVAADQFNSIDYQENSAYWLAGYTTLPSVNSKDILLVSVDENGNINSNEGCSMPATFSTFPANITTSNTNQTRYEWLAFADQYFSSNGFQLTQQLSPCESIQLEDKLLLHFDFCKCMAEDISSNENNGEIIGNPNCIEGALELNITDELNDCGIHGGEYIELPAFDPIWEEGISICAFVRFDSDGNYERIIELGNGIGEEDGLPLWFGREEDTNNLTLESWINDDPITNRETGRISANNVIQNGTYHQYCATISESLMRLYVDGEMVAEKEGQMMVNNTRSSNYIGRSSYCSDPDLTAGLEDIIIYNRGLNQSEIQALYENFTFNEDCLSVATNTVSTQALQLFPNPTSHLLKIVNIPAAAQKMRITAINGHIIMEKVQIFSEEENIDTRGLIPGIYYISFYLNNGTILNQRFIKL